MDTVVYVDEQRMLKSDGTHAHADLDLHCPQNALGPFRALGISRRRSSSFFVRFSYVSSVFDCFL